MSSDVPKKRLPPADRREQLLDHAGRLFAERGFDGTRLDDVAAAAGVTKPIVYRHFANKTALYLGVLERHQQDLPSFIGGVPADAPLEQRLHAIVDGWLDYVGTHAYAWSMLFRDAGGGPEVDAFRREVGQSARDVLAGMLQLAADPVPADQVQAQAELLRAGMAGLALWWIDDPVARPRDVVVETITRVWVAVLSPAR